METSVDLDDLAGQISDQEQKLPPVEKWSPAFTGDLDMKIERDGRWYYLGSEIKRKPLVKLFSSILVKEGDDYFLVTPVEKYRIQVAYLPFVAVTVERAVDSGKSVLIFTTNVGDQVIVNQQHPLWVIEEEGAPMPIVRIRRNLDALISRNAFYDLAAWGEPNPDDPQELTIKSDDVRFSLGRV